MIAWANTFGVNDLVHPFQIIASFVYFGHWKGLRNKPEKKNLEATNRLPLQPRLTVIIVSSWTLEHENLKEKTLYLLQEPTYRKHIDLLIRFRFLASTSFLNRDILLTRIPFPYINLDKLVLEKLKGKGNIPMI